MSEPILFNVEDALDLQALQVQRLAIEGAIADLINKYGVTGPATVIQDSKGRWIGIQAVDPEPALSLVKDSDPVEAVS